MRYLVVPTAPALAGWLRPSGTAGAGAPEKLEAGDRLRRAAAAARSSPARMFWGGSSRKPTEEATDLRRRMNNELNFPPSFERLVLGCIDADFCK